MFYHTIKSRLVLNSSEPLKFYYVQPDSNFYQDTYSQHYSFVGLFNKNLPYFQFVCVPFHFLHHLHIILIFFPSGFFVLFLQHILFLLLLMIFFQIQALFLICKFCFHIYEVSDFTLFMMLLSVYRLNQRYLYRGSSL